MKLFGNSLSSGRNGRNTYDTSVSKFLYGGRLSDALTGKNKIVNGMEDPSNFAFVFGIIAERTGLFGDPNLDGMIVYDTEIDRSYSVLTYLRNAISPNTQKIYEENDKLVISPDDLYTKGEDGTYGGVKPELMTFPLEYYNMYNFVNGFKRITTDHPYMFQTIDGLQDAYKTYFNSHKDAFLGLKDGKIKIKCLEAMDLRMSALFDSYFRAVYNHKYRRMNIPRNLLRFDCWVLVHDLRNLKVSDNYLYSSVYDENTKKIITNNLSTIFFRFKNCTFDIEEIGAMLGGISNAEAKQTEFEFAFNYNDVEVQVNSLADALEFKNTNSDDYYNLLDIVSLNADKRSKESETAKKGYEESLFSDATNALLESVKNKATSRLKDKYNLDDAYFDAKLDLTRTLNRVGSALLHVHTGGGLMGNIYDESWAGLLSSMMSSISTAGVPGIINHVLGAGDQHMMGRIFDTNNQMNSTTGSRPGREPGENQQDNPYTELDNIYGDNAYGMPVLTAHLLGQDYGNVYSNQPSGIHQNLNPGTVYQIPADPQPYVQEEAYEQPQPHEELQPESIDMTDTNHQPFVQENIEFEVPTQEPLEKGYVYEPVKQKQNDEFGSVYVVTATEAQYIPVNVYDRIIESNKNEIPSDKIYVSPEKPPQVKIENKPKPVKETKALTFDLMNAFSNDTKQKIVNQINSIGNVYTD